MPDSDFNIAIVGAGIGGLALAIGLSHLSIPFTIYEAAPAFSAVGAGVGLGPNALRAMDLIDKRFREMYMDIATGNLNPEKKHVMMEAMRMEDGLGEGEDWWGNGGWGAEYFERTGAHRKDLLDIMTSFIDKSCVRFGVRVKSIEQGNGSVSLEFENGEVVNHVAVVGCDGVKGFTRRVVLGERWPEHVEPKYTRRYVYRAIVPMEEAKEIMGDLATDAKMYMAKGMNLSTYPISEGREVNVVAFKSEEKDWSCKESAYEITKEEMLNDFREHNIDERLLRLIDRAKPLRWGIFHHPMTPTYISSQMCLLGDVAHASGPHQGAGAGQCLEDALILSRAFGVLCSSTPSDVLLLPTIARKKLVESAFQAYDEIRRPRAQEQVLTSEDCGKIYNLMGEGLGGDMHAILKNLNARFAWIWEHDLEEDVRKVEARWRELVGIIEDGECQNNEVGSARL